MRSIRGATTVENNDRQQILAATKEMLEKIMNINAICIDDIISIVFTCTRDLTKAYPAVGARELGIVNAALMCFDELYVEGSLPLCIRTMVNVEIDKKQSDVKHVYLKGTKELRPDLSL